MKHNYIICLHQCLKLFVLLMNSYSCDSLMYLIFRFQLYSLGAKQKLSNQYLQFVPQDGREDFGANDEEEDYDEEPAPRRGLDDEFDDEEDEDDEVDYIIISSLCVIYLYSKTYLHYRFIKALINI